jgi:hypothetical protein
MAYSELYYPPTSNGLSKTLDAALDKGMTASLTLTNVTGIQNKPGVVVINRIDSNSAELSTSLREYVSYTTVSGKTLMGLARHLGGTTDQDHAVGSVVEFILDITWGQAMIDAFLVEHVEATAVHSSALVTTLKATGAVVTTGTSDLTIVTPKALADAGISLTASSTNTLTNKRISPRVVTTTDDATAVIDVDVTDQYQLTAIANATEFTVTGTPVNGQKLIIRLKDAGVAKALTWTGFTAIGCTAPTTTVASKTHYIGCIYNSATPTWNIVAAIVEA